VYGILIILQCRDTKNPSIFVLFGTQSDFFCHLPPKRGTQTDFSCISGTQSDFFCISGTQTHFFGHVVIRSCGHADWHPGMAGMEVHGQNNLVIIDHHT